MTPRSPASCRDSSPPSGACSTSTSSPATSPVRSQGCASVCAAFCTSREQRGGIDGHSTRDSANRQNRERVIFMNVGSYTVKTGVNRLSLAGSGAARAAAARRRLSGVAQRQRPQGFWNLGFTPPRIAPGHPQRPVAHRPLVLWRRSRLYCALTTFPSHVRFSMSLLEPLLFDSDDLPRKPVDGSLTIRPPAERPLSKEERAFNRAVAKVQALRARLDEEKRRLDRALVFEATELRPRLERVTTLRTALVRGFVPFLDDRRLKPAQKQTLRAILKEQLDEIFSHVRRPDADLNALFERLHGIGHDEAVQGELDEARSSMAAMFDELGVDVDVPELHPDMSDEDLAAAAARLADGMRRAEEQRTTQAVSHRKTRRERDEEERVRRFEQLRKDNIGAGNKRLVKVLHPDLEANPVEREKKSRAMQEVTAAYARRDLHALLCLEIDWIEGAGCDTARLGADKLRAHAELLKEQASDLEAECYQLRFHPRYAALIVEGPLGMPVLIDGPREAASLDDLIASLRIDVQRLGSDEAITAVRETLHVYREARRAEARAALRQRIGTY